MAIWAISIVHVSLVHLEAFGFPNRHPHVQIATNNGVNHGFQVVQDFVHPQ